MSIRARYWSLSKFASKLRTVFGLPPVPEYATSVKWDEFHELEKSISPFGLKIIHSLDSLQNLVNFIPDKFNDLTYYISNVLNSNHVLKTRVKFGSWGDLTSKIPDSLMLAVIDFVEKECFFMNVRWYSERPEGISDSAWNFASQSSFRRRFFPVKVSSEDRSKIGLDYIKFQMKEGPDEAKSRWVEIIDAYKFAKEEYFSFDAFEIVDYHSLDGVGSLTVTLEKREAFAKIRILEEEFENKVTLHCSNLVKNRGYLWT